MKLYKGYGTVECPPPTPVRDPSVCIGVVLVVPKTIPVVLVTLVGRPLAEATPVIVALTVPVQAALRGQHATFPASSNVQVVSGGQQASSAPRFEHAPNPDWHP